MSRRRSSRMRSRRGMRSTRAPRAAGPQRPRRAGAKADRRPRPSGGTAGSRTSARSRRSRRARPQPRSPLTEKGICPQARVPPGQAPRRASRGGAGGRPPALPPAQAPRAPGFEIVETPRYRVVLQPDFPIPGPNGVTYVRCRPDEAEEVIDEVHALVTPRHIPIMWTLDPETEPANFPDYLAARGIHPDPHGPTVEVMALPIDADVEAPEVEGLELKDALADAETFTRSDAVNAEAFASRMLDYSAEAAAQRERRRHNQLAAANRRVILATIDGEPAGAAGITLFPPAGAIINCGAARSNFRGRGGYRTMVAARLRMAREAGVTSGPPA